MRAERRGRVILVSLVVNRHVGRYAREEPGERTEVVRDFQAHGLRGLPEGEGQQGRGGRRRAVGRAVRAGPQGEPVQAVEPDVVGLLFPAAGADDRDPQAGRQGVRVLGVPSVADRIAQTVAAMVLEPEVEKIFHPDSYGYRPGKSALDAVAACRERCWHSDWVIDLDIKGFFDNLDHGLVLKAVAHHTDQKWILLYVRRWLKAPLQRPDGTLVAGIAAVRRARRSHRC